MSSKSEEIIDVRDGLNIADRKVLSVLFDVIPPGKRFRQSSKITREIKERYSIDSDESYEILVDLARWRNTMYLVEGNGNFSYRPAASDYTECGISPLLRYLSENGFISSDVTIPFGMPLPFLLTAGTPGFCSIESKIPVHDLGAVMCAVYSLIKDPGLTNTDLAHIIKGPKLEIGGTIINTEDLPKIYEKGHGKIHFSISKKTLNPHWGWYYSIKDICNEFCGWYGHDLSKPAGAKKGYYEITVQYNSLLTNGAENRYFSLKEILTEYIKHYKHLIQVRYGFSPDGDILCELLRSEVELLNNNYSGSEYKRHSELILGFAGNRSPDE